MIIELTPATIYVSVLGFLHGYFFITLTIFLARPLAELACVSTKSETSGLSRNITYGMAVLFLVTVFFSLSLSWVLLFAAGDPEAVKEYFRQWALFWFVGIIFYSVVVRAGRALGRRT